MTACELKKGLIVAPLWPEWRCRVDVLLQFAKFLVNLQSKTQKMVHGDDVFVMMVDVRTGRRDLPFISCVF